MNKILLIVVFFTVACGSTQKNSSSQNSSSNNAYETAKQTWAAGDEQKAKQLFIQVTKELAAKDNLSSTEHLALGDSNFYLQNYEKAQYYLGKYLETNSSDTIAVCKMGKTKFHMEFYKDAIPYLQKCHKNSPQDAQISYFLARSMQKSNQGVNKEALTLYQKSAENGNTKAMLELAEIYRYNKYNSRAKKLYEKYIRQGGKLGPQAQEWLSGQQPPVVAVAPTPEQSTSVEVPVEEAQPEEILMVCPVCGRLGEKDSQLCTFDGEPLEPLN
ncbi:tetratricopeptide repeat protein [Candidatus Uabimicrobium sp. HlEnr_7]|uniref:tetratricopeptide repeat protein n=1 Tax=Candidatus Uabimicrobium helgolandensis TaxID=3095367 RepID=UPI0035585EBE